MSIDPAIPFTIIHTGRRYIDGDSNNLVNFEAPAPAGSFIRFFPLRDEGQTEVSFDSGQTWVEAQEQPAAKQVLLGIDGRSNYWHALPDGATSFMVRAGAGNRGDWFVFDFRIWSSNTDGALVPAPSPTAASAGATAVLPAEAPSVLPATGSEPRAGSNFPWTIVVALVAGGVTLLAGGAAVLRLTRYCGRGGIVLRSARGVSVSGSRGQELNPRGS